MAFLVGQPTDVVGKCDYFSGVCRNPKLYGSVISALAIITSRVWLSLAVKYNPACSLKLCRKAIIMSGNQVIYRHFRASSPRSSRSTPASAEFLSHIIR